ncbi:hypothetical protein XELAEV_18020180mg [Xenopus laevis]|uniref:Uncharacterized protein n=1 Tax=Xenopus laevis TaxID=8355 RepID=A0A974HQE5_XENLA|nr:hypothetical protein XELAEV_18020180mg [Xenopus laevis]
MYKQPMPLQTCRERNVSIKKGRKRGLCSLRTSYLYWPVYGTQWARLSPCSHFPFSSIINVMPTTDIDAAGYRSLQNTHIPRLFPPNLLTLHASCEWPGSRHAPEYICM